MKFYNEEKIVKFGTIIGTNKKLLALRDGFAYTMPITILGSFLVLLLNLPVPGYTELMLNIFGENWNDLFNSIYIMTIPLLSVYSVIGISYAYCVQYDKKPILNIIVSLMAFLILTPILLGEDGSVISDGLNTVYFGPKGMFMSIILGLGVPMLLEFMSEIKYFKISMPDQVPSAVSGSFNKLIPIILISFLIGLVALFFKAFLSNDPFTFIYEFFQTPIRQIVGQSYLGGALSLFFVNLSWFFGLHGGLLLSPINQVAFGELMTSNIDAYASGEAIPFLFSGIPFMEVFSKMGGAGVGLSLLVAIKLVSKQAAAKKITSLALAPSLFNIVEPLVFGLPIVFNPILIIPFVLVPIVTYTLAYIFTMLGLMAPLVVQVPWTIPIGFNAYISTGGDWMTVVFQLLIFVVAVLCYIPFIKIWDKSQEKINEELNK